MRRYIPRLAVHRLEDRDNPASSFLAVGAAAGGLPLLDVQRPDGTQLARFQAFESDFRGGVRAVAGELDGNPNTLEVVAAAGPGGGPIVKVFRVDLTTAAVTEAGSFFAFDPDFRGGLRVATGRVSGNTAVQQIVVAADGGGGPHVKAFNLNGTQAAGPLGSFFAFEPGFTGGIRVAAGELDGNPANGDELVVAAGPGGGPRVLVFRSDGTVLSDTFAFRPDFLGGVNVSVEATGGQTDRLRVDAETDDFSQRNAGLNIAALDAVRPVAVDTTPTSAAVLDAVSQAQLNGALVQPNPSGLSSGFFPTAGSVFGTTGNNAFDLASFGNVDFGNAGFGTSGFGTNVFGTSVFGTNGFGTTGFDSTFGVAGLGTPGFGTGGFSTNGFGNTGFGNTFGTGVFGNPGPLNAFPAFTTTTPFIGNSVFVPTTFVSGTTGF